MQPWLSEPGLCSAGYLWDPTLSLGCSQKGGAGSENAALTELKSDKLCHFWRFLQNLDENKKDSLLYSQNEPARTPFICTNELFNYQTLKIELLYVTEKSTGFKKRTSEGTSSSMVPISVKLWEHVQCQ